MLLNHSSSHEVLLALPAWLGHHEILLNKKQNIAWREDVVVSCREQNTSNVSSNYNRVADFHGLGLQVWNEMLSAFFEQVTLVSPNSNQTTLQINKQNHHSGMYNS